MSENVIIGIDEVGRGPIAGPVTIGGVLVAERHYPEILDRFADIRDSKKLSEKRRHAWIDEIKEAQEEGILHAAVASLDAGTIDARGIRWCLNTAVERCLDDLQQQSNVTAQNVAVLLDGGLQAPDRYTQESVVKGDESEVLIALASIVAKVTRDTYMYAQAEQFPVYGLERHKGYGTKAHFEAIKAHGPCPLHRKTFLKIIAS